MAVRTVGARVKIDGEAEYKQALKELNSGSRVLASEMKKLQAEYKGNADSTEYLSKKGELLERSLLQQKDKVETLREALANSARQTGEASEETQKWQVSLNNAEAEMYELQHAVEENNQALQGESQTMIGLGDVADQLASKLGINIPDGAKQALNGITSMSAGSVAALGAIAAGVAIAIKAIKELHDTTIEAAADVDELITQSMVTGLSTKTLQELQYAENLIDVSVDTMVGSMTKLTSNMAAARDGNTAMQESFAALGVSITDSSVQLRSAEAVFYDVIDALGEIENPTERDAAAMELLGKSAQDLNPLIIQGTDALRELMAEADEFYVLNDEQIAKLGEVDDAFQRNQLTVEAFKKQLAAEFAPASQAAMELFTRVVKSAGEMLVNSRIVENLANAIQGLIGLLDAGMNLFDNLPGWMNPLNQLSAAFQALGVVLATVADAMNVIAGIMPWNWGSGMLTTALGLNAKNGQYSNIQRVTGQAAEWEDWRSSAWNAGRNAAGTANWRGGLTWVGESGPELAALPAGTRIYSAQESQQLAGGDTFYISIDAASVKEFNDIVRIAQSARVRNRMR